MSKNKRLLKILSLLISLIFYFSIFFYIDIGNVEKGYFITLFLPLVFIICFFAFLWDPLLKSKSPFISLFTGVAFVRYVILSLLTVLEGSYNGLSGIAPSPESLHLAGLLMIWEIVISSIFIRYWYGRKLKSVDIQTNKTLVSKANPLVYIIFILLSVSLLILIPQSRQGLSFFSEISYSLNDEVGSLLVLGIREAFINAKYFILFVLVIILQMNNGVKFFKNRFLSYITILITCVIIIGIRIGANRKKMLSDSIAILLVLWRIFPSYKRFTAIFISLIGVGLVAVTTVFRGMTESVGNFLTDYFNLELLQPYFLGQYNIAISIEAIEFFPDMINIQTYILSFLRPVFGIGSIVKDIDFISAANVFDLRMSEGIMGFRGDQILPIIGEGYMLFGFLLSPLLLLVTIRLGVFFDTLYLKSNKLEIVFISSLISFYLAQGMILNSTILINMLSFKLAIYAPVVLLAYQLKRRDKFKK